MPVRRFRVVVLAAVAATVLHVLPPGATASTPAACTTQWVAAWLASPSDADPDGFRDQTMRQVISPQVAGEQIRVHLSNRFGTGPVTFGAAAIARGGDGSAVLAGTTTPLTFAGRRAVTVPAGSEVVSDPAPLRVAAFEKLAVSVWVAGSTGPATRHFIGRRTGYATSPGAGDRTADTTGGAFNGPTTTSRYFLSGVDVLPSRPVAAVVAVGDSLTDGYVGSHSPLVPNLEALDRAGSYPEALQRRIAATRGAPAISVVNAGITGNRLLRDGPLRQHGVAGIARLWPDALANAGVTHVIALQGINDIGSRSADAGQVIAGLGTLVTQAHAAGRRILLGTLPPALGATSETYGDAQTDAIRREVNGWIRTQRSADGVVDFDAVLRDPDQPSRLRRELDSGDHLHPNLAGYRTMAGAVDLALLRGTCTATGAGPAPRTCRRTVTLRVPSRYRARLRLATVEAAGRRVGTLRRGRAALRVSLRGAAGTTVRVRVRMKLRGGRTVTQVRRIRVCLS